MAHKLSGHFKMQVYYYKVCNAYLVSYIYIDFKEKNIYYIHSYIISKPQNWSR